MRPLSLVSDTFGYERPVRLMKDELVGGRIAAKFD